MQHLAIKKTISLCSNLQHKLKVCGNNRQQSEPGEQDQGRLYSAAVYFFAAAMAEMMSPNSALREAPPTKKPSMSGHAERAPALAALADPPYCERPE